MYRVCKTDLVLLHSRGKAHKIISHAIAEDADVEWSDIKRKLMSNYGSTRSGIEASVKISKLSISSKETVGKYLTRARTLVKSKIKNIAMWHSDFDEADPYHVCNRLFKTGLKSRMLRRVSKFKTYKEFSIILKTSGNKATSWKTTLQEKRTHKVQLWKLKNLRLEWNSYRQPHESRNVGRSQWGVP